MNVRLMLALGGTLAMMMAIGCAAPSEDGHDGGVRFRVGSMTHDSQQLTKQVQQPETHSSINTNDSPS